MFISLIEILYQLCMVLDCGFNPLRFNANVALSDGSGAVLQETLHTAAMKTAAKKLLFIKNAH